jgi:hypothetical protein
MQEGTPLVLELGSETHRLGMAGEELPRELPARTADDTSDGVVVDRGIESHHGVVELVEQVSSGLGMAWPGQLALVLPSKTKLSTIKLLMRDLLETPGAQRVFLGDALPMHGLGAGHASGFVIDIGDGGFSCGYVNEHAALETVEHGEVGLGGYRATCAVRDVLRGRGVELDLATARRVKHSYSAMLPPSDMEFVSGSRWTKMFHPPSEPFALPDGTSIPSAQCASACAHGLSRLVDGASAVLSRLLERNPDCDVSEDLPREVVFSGGCSGIPGLMERVALECPASVTGVYSPEAANCGFLGASIVASMSTFEKMSVSPQDLSEYGMEALMRVTGHV